MSQKPQDKHIEKQPNKTISLIVMLFGVAGGILAVVLGLTKKSESINLCIFGKKDIQTEEDKIELLKTLAFYLSIFLFGLTTFVMTIRVLTASPNPAKGRDNLIISTVNRIISNTIEQSIIFGGLFGALLYDDIDHVSQIGRTKLVAFASLFVIARVCFTVGYLLVSITGIPSWRSFGFVMNFTLSVLMVGRLCNCDLIPGLLNSLTPYTNEIPV